MKEEHFTILIFLSNCLSIYGGFQLITKFFIVKHNKKINKKAILIRGDRDGESLKRDNEISKYEKSLKYKILEIIKKIF